MINYIFSHLDGEFFFLDPETKISKVAPDYWKKVASATFTVFLRVKFFPDDIYYILYVFFIVYIYCISYLDCLLKDPLTSGFYLCLLVLGSPMW